MCRVEYPKAADKGKSDAVWKVSDPGLKMTSTPINPSVTAAHLRGPTVSFKKTTGCNGPTVGGKIIKNY